MLVVDGGPKNASLTAFSMNGIVQLLKHLRSNHEEAETRLLHANDVLCTHDRVIAQSPDTDIEVIARCQELYVNDQRRYVPNHLVGKSLRQNCV